MVDFDILEEFGTTNKVIRDFFTAKMPGPRRAAAMTAEELRKCERTVKARQEWEQKISSWLNENVVFSLRNSKLYSAVDFAWDAMPINKIILPLMQYATGRITTSAAVKELQALPDGASYVRKNAAGEDCIDLPKFTEVNINLVRSIITRRVAAQAVKYNNSYPFYKYDARDRTQVGQLRGEMTSERIEIMADQYDYRHFQTQLTRDMFKYGHSVAFPRSSWEREVRIAKATPAKEFNADKLRKKNVVVKEGIAWVNPHPSRVFYDNAYPLSSINKDIGCNYIGFWDVCRYGDISDNPDYFNRKEIQYSADSVSWFSAYSSYFSQYYDTLRPPTLASAEGDAAANNDRKNNIGRYTPGMEDMSTFFSHLCVKVNPRAEGWGKYPYPIWVLLKVAGDNTVVYADILPSGPGAYYGYNEDDSRLVSASVAHELLPFQDQLTNLFSQLLETVKQDLFSVAVLNTDVFPDTEDGRKVRTEFENLLKGKNYYASMQVLAASFDKLKGLGISLTADNIFKVVRSAPNTAIDKIFSAITQTLVMADRLQVMSAHEQGQTAQHEMSATESNLIAGSTDTIYDFISSGLDEGREATKRICFESTIACDSDQVVLSVNKRYPQSIVEKAGFRIESAEDGDVGFMQVVGDKNNLATEYLFTSRDGGNRQSNTQAATVMVQMLQAIGSLNPSAQNAVLSAMGKSKLLEVINGIWRKADAGVDLNLQLKPGEGDELLMEDDQQVMGLIQRLGQAVNQNTNDVQQILQSLQSQQPQPQQTQQG